MMSDKQPILLSDILKSMVQCVSCSRVTNKKMGVWWHHVC